MSRRDARAAGARRVRDGRTATSSRASGSSSTSSRRSSPAATRRSPGSSRRSRSRASTARTTSSRRSGPRSTSQSPLGTGDHETAVVGLTQPDGPGQVRGARRQAERNDSAGEQSSTARSAAGTRSADNQASIDARARGADGRRSPTTRLTRTRSARLPGETLVKAYVDGQQLDAAIQQAAKDVALALGSPASAALEGVRYARGCRERRGRRHPRPRRLATAATSAAPTTPRSCSEARPATRSPS